jgi:hypothetical protein
MNTQAVTSTSCLTGEEYAGPALEKPIISPGGIAVLTEKDGAESLLPTVLVGTNTPQTIPTSTTAREAASNAT